MKPIPPCYDSVNKQDCPDRRPGCHSRCKKWGKYQKHRDRDYGDRTLREDTITDGHKRARTNYLKKEYHRKYEW